MVEFALVMIPLTILLYGLIVFGMMFALKQSMTSAAADAARSAIGATSGDEVTAAQNTLQDRLGWLGDKYSPSDSPTPEVKPCMNDVSKSCITVKLAYPHNTKPLLPLAPGLGLITPSSINTEATVQLS